jgi:NAD(P)-dependent dehydrogenase (short-subunit alcohol dehydrogenase family)
VTQTGGRGIAVRCDHTDEADVASLFGRVDQDHGRLDLLVNNAWGGHESFDGVFQAPFWERPMRHWDTMFDRGVRNPPASQPLCGAAVHPPATRPDRHHDLLGPRPLHGRQPVL